MSEFLSVLDLGPEIAADIGLAQPPGNERGELAPSPVRNAIATGLALTAAAGVAAIIEAGIVPGREAENAAPKSGKYWSGNKWLFLHAWSDIFFFFFSLNEVYTQYLVTYACFETVSEFSYTPCIFMILYIVVIFFV